MTAVPTFPADEINREYRLAREHAKTAVAHAIRCGELLMAAKAGVSHGTWLPWLSERCPEISDRTARAYMRLSRESAKLDPENRQRVADLSVRDAIRAVAANTGALRRVPIERLPAVEARWEDAGGSIYGHALQESELINQSKARARQQSVFVDPSPVTIEDDRPVAIKHVRGRTWHIYVGPNELGEKYDTWGLERLIRDAAKHAAPLAEIRAHRDLAQRECDAAQRRLDQIESELRQAARLHIEHTVGIIKHQENCTVELSDRDTAALLELPPRAQAIAARELLRMRSEATA